VPALSAFFRPALPEPTLLNHSFFYLFDHPLDLLSELMVTGAYPALPWVSYICAGLIVGRLTLSSVKVARRLLIFGVALAVAAATASWYLLGPLGGRAALRLAAPGPLNDDGDTVDDLLVFGFDGTTPTGGWWWLATSAPHSATPLDLLRTIGIAVAVLGAMLLLDHIAASRLRRVVHIATAPLAAAGSMTLTLYVATVVFLNSPLDQFSPVGGYVFQVVAVLLFAVGWRQAVGRGPLETAVTAVANGARAWAAQVTSKKRRPLKVDPASTPEEESFSWWEDEADGSPAESSEPEPKDRRRAWSPAREWSTSTASDEDVWSWWENDAAPEPSKRGPRHRRRAWSPAPEWSTSTAPDEDVWSWWENDVKASAADSSAVSGSKPDSSTSSRGIR
jgi:hypothetical protein